MSKISYFRGEYAFLSNFYLCPVELEGVIYPSAEHAFQAAKVLDPHVRAFIRDARTPREAKHLGRRVVLRPQWEQVKIPYMIAVLMGKFQKSATLLPALLATHPRYLEEGNTWKDHFWGVCNGYGENQLGKALMQVRDHLRVTTSVSPEVHP